MDDEPRMRASVNAPAGLSDVEIGRWQRAVQQGIDWADLFPDEDQPRVKMEFSMFLHQGGFDDRLMFEFCEAVIKARAQRTAAQSHEGGHA